MRKYESYDLQSGLFLFCFFLNIFIKGVYVGLLYRMFFLMALIMLYNSKTI